ncbi:MAG: hypothetical protein R3E79_39960 [Caldilineaceae bacterium]
MTTAVFTCHPASCKGRSRRFLYPGDFGDNPDEALAQFVIGRLHIDHEITINFPKFDHGAGAQHIQHTQWWSPCRRRSRVLPVNATRAGDNLNCKLGRCGVGVAGLQTTAAVVAPTLFA